MPDQRRQFGGNSASRADPRFSEHRPPRCGQFAVRDIGGVDHATQLGDFVFETAGVRCRNVRRRTQEIVGVQHAAGNLLGALEARSTCVDVVAELVEPGKWRQSVAVEDKRKKRSRQQPSHAPSIRQAVKARLGADDGLTPDRCISQLCSTTACPG